MNRTPRLFLFALALLLAPPAHGGLPPENTCPTVGGAMPGGGGEDAVPLVVREGLVLDAEQLQALRTLVPDEVWEHRDAFFHEGMKMEIGACHRRYATAAAYRTATEQHAVTVKLNDEGGLEGYVAGLPFPPDEIAPERPDAGLRWAWNAALRWVAVGPHGKFRLTDFPSRRIGTPETYIGTFFLVHPARRADLAGSGFREPGMPDLLFAAGGRFDEPTNARHLAWRQLRDADALEDWNEIDDIFVYVPTMRKSRRAAATWVDGAYVPRYSVSGDTGGSPVPFGSGAYGPTDAISPNSGLSIAQTENMRRGLTGLTLRPNAYSWRLVGERDVLAPLNGTREGWPGSPDRNFGESGLSVASDRWDVRHAVVLDGQLRRSDDEVGRVRIFLDWQTQQPLYWITRRTGGALIEIGILVHRYTGDLAQYPPLADGSAANLFDPVAAVFYGAADGGTGWRRESYGVFSVPTEELDLRAMTSTDQLQRGR